MYTEFYNFSAPPFRLVPDQRFFFGSRGHCKALAYLKFGLQQGEGFIVVTGEIGAGKSTLVSRLFAELDGAAIAAALIATTQVQAKDALRLILAAFKIKPVTADKAAMLGAFESFLKAQRAAGRRVLLAIDEAQGLPRQTLEELRMLSNILVDGRSAFQCFMLGQPQFMELMARPDLEQFRQRVVASCHLGPFAASETRAYIEHRLKLAGWAGDPAFSDGAFQRIHDATCGIPRRINLLCSRLLFYGALEALHEIDAAAVDEVLDDLAREAINPVGSPRNGTPFDAVPGRRSTDPFPFARRSGAAVLTRITAFLDRLDQRLDAQEEMLRCALDLFAPPAATPVPRTGRPREAADGEAAQAHVTGDDIVDERPDKPSWAVGGKAR